MTLKKDKKTSLLMKPKYILNGGVLADHDPTPPQTAILPPTVWVCLSKKCVAQAIIFTTKTKHFGPSL